MRGCNGYKYQDPDSGLWYFASGMDEVEHGPFLEVLEGVTFYGRVWVRRVETKDIKIYDIETRVPSLTALYIKLDKESGQFKIYLGTLSSEEQKTIEELDESPKVKELVDSVQKSLEDVVSSDQQVREFYDMLESVEDDSSDSSEE